MIGVFEVTFVGWGFSILKHYNLDLDSSIDKEQHPYDEWNTVAYSWMGPYIWQITLWAVNAVIGNNGNAVDWFFNASYLLLFGQPLASFYFGLKASESYGTEAEVDLGTDWAMTIADDSKYNFYFLLN